MLPARAPGQGGKLKLKPLARLAPYIARYRGRALAALAALVVAALTTLLVPVAVRRMIDFGFSDKAVQLIDSYFAVMILVVAVLAISSALRYYLVTTLGERIVADLRSDVFGHLTRLSSEFFDTARTGEIVSRLTADTTRSSRRSALRYRSLCQPAAIFGGAAMMVVTSPMLSLFVLGAIPVIVLPLVGFGRAVRKRGRAAQDTLAEASGYADELIGAMRTLQAFTNEKLAQSHFSSAVEQAYAAARGATKARGVLTAVVIFLVFASIVVVVWVGAKDVPHRPHHRRKAVAVRALCGVRRRRLG
jgi:ATP-binding cassette subfamily B protein